MLELNRRLRDTNLYSSQSLHRNHAWLEEQNRRCLLFNALGAQLLFYAGQFAFYLGELEVARERLKAARRIHEINPNRARAADEYLKRLELGRGDSQALLRKLIETERLLVLAAIKEDRGLAVQANQHLQEINDSSGAEPFVEWFTELVDEVRRLVEGATSRRMQSGLGVVAVLARSH